MATKICSKKEMCLNGNIRQDYSNFDRDKIRGDGHSSLCKDCVRAIRKAVHEETKKRNEVFKNMFI